MLFRSPLAVCDRGRRRDRRLAIIKGLGAHTVDVRRATLSAVAEHVFKTDKPEVLIDQTGDPQLLREALDMIARRGTLFIYDFTGHDILFNFGALQLREITIKYYQKNFLNMLNFLKIKAVFTFS